LRATGILNFKIYKCVSGARGSVVGWALCYQPEDPGSNFDEMIRYF
jgi:hypothetical protein